MWRRMSSCSLNITRERVGSGVFRHFGNASLAACTASLNSAAVVSGSRETTSCVACSAFARDNGGACSMDQLKALKYVGR